MNAKEPEQIDKFIELRSLDWPFARIAAELKISKPTLISWSRKYHHRIQNLRAVALESLAQDCKLTHTQSVEDLGEILRRIREELAKRDLADIPTARLISLAADLRAEAHRLNGPIHFSEPSSDPSPGPGSIPAHLGLLTFNT